jgi:hypothetical protein
MEVVLFVDPDGTEKPVLNIFDAHFKCRSMSVFKLVKEVISFNGFFGDLVKTAVQKT